MQWEAAKYPDEIFEMGWILKIPFKGGSSLVQQPLYWDTISVAFNRQPRPASSAAPSVNVSASGILLGIPGSPVVDH